MAWSLSCPSIRIWSSLFTASASINSLKNIQLERKSVLTVTMKSVWEAVDWRKNIYHILLQPIFHYVFAFPAICVAECPRQSLRFSAIPPFLLQHEDLVMYVRAECPWLFSQSRMYDPMKRPRYPLRPHDRVKPGTASCLMASFPRNRLHFQFR